MTYTEEEQLMMELYLWSDALLKGFRKWKNSNDASNRDSMKAIGEKTFNTDLPTFIRLVVNLGMTAVPSPLVESPEVE